MKITSHSKSVSAVYILKRGGEVIYVGQTGNLVKRLREHKRKGFDSFDFIEVPEKQRRTREEQLIMLHRPSLNKWLVNDLTECARCKYKWHIRRNRPPKVCPICKHKKWMLPKPADAWKHTRKDLRDKFFPKCKRKDWNK